MLWRKPRTKFGQFLDDHGLKQKSVAKESGVSEAEVSKLCDPKLDVVPQYQSKIKLINALRRLTDKNVKINDFWC